MEIGIDSFAATPRNLEVSSSQALTELLERIELADKVGLDVFGIGEHYRKEFLDSASAMILAAAASRTSRIHLTSAVTVLSAADPVRVFQNFSTLDLISQGRAEIVVGRGSFIESFPLFGLNLDDYDALFSEKLDLLLKIRNNEFVNGLVNFVLLYTIRLYIHVLFKVNYRFGLELVVHLHPLCEQEK